MSAPGKCKHRTEVWSRVCGFFRPVSQWNHGKKAEYADRVEYAMTDQDKNKEGDLNAKK